MEIMIKTPTDDCECHQRPVQTSGGFSPLSFLLLSPSSGVGQVSRGSGMGQEQLGEATWGLTARLASRRDRLGCVRGGGHDRQEGRGREEEHRL